MHRYAREAYEMGIRYIGGCCGFEPYHIRAVAEELAKVSRQGDSLQGILRVKAMCLGERGIWARLMRTKPLRPETHALSTGNPDSNGGCGGGGGRNPARTQEAQSPEACGPTQALR